MRILRVLLGFALAVGLVWLQPPSVARAKDLTCDHSLPGGWTNSTVYSGRWNLGVGNPYYNDRWVCSYFGPSDALVEVDAIWDTSDATQAGAALCALAVHGATPAPGQAYLFSKTRAAAAIYGPVSPGPGVSDATVAGLQKAAANLLGQAEPLAIPCPRTGPAPITCTVQGTVTDAFAEPVVGALVELDWGQNHKAGQVFTGPGGTFTLPPPNDKDFDAARDDLSIKLTLLEQHGTVIRFQLLYHGSAAKVQTLPFKLKDGCAQQLRLNSQAKGLFLSNPARAADLAQDGLIFVRTQQALDFAQRMGVAFTKNLPLPIFTFCTGSDDPLQLCATQSQSFYLGNYPNQAPHHPYLALLPKDSIVTESDPNDSLYHELGHAVMDQAFGSLPQTPNSIPHGGFLNHTSTDSWVEGFADWFAIMVNKYVEKVGVAERLVLSSSTIDVKSIHQATDPYMEEFAVAGVLLDLEDGPQDYPLGRPLPISDLAVVRIVQPGGKAGYVVGTIPTIEGAVGSIEVRVRFQDSQGRDLGAAGAWVSSAASDAGQRYFLLPIPAGLHPARATIEEIRGRSSQRADTDGLNVGFGSLMAAILDYPATAAGGHRAPGDPSWSAAGYVLNMSELYSALKHAFGGRDVRPDGTDSVDRVFIVHGFFADLDGNQAWRPGEAVGSTDFVTGGKTIARPSPGNPPILFAQVPGAADAQAIVFVHYVGTAGGDDYSYQAQPDQGGWLALAVPKEKAQVTVMLVPPIGSPRITQTVDSAAFWAVAEHAKGPFLKLQAVPQSGPSDPASVLVGVLSLALWAGALVLLLRVPLLRLVPARRPPHVPAPLPPSLGS
ncbi:MAG TPA: carboxypeptidase-like regulatory domain-containing protein [Candidatus Dormibacteraeota bacterium]